MTESYLCYFWHIMTEIMKMSNESKTTDSRSSSTYVFHDVGFHGDSHLLSLVDHIIKSADITCFVETGANVGSTVTYIAKRYPGISCYSCEPDKMAFELAEQNAAGLDNVSLYNLTSQDFLKILEKEIPDIEIKKTLFWLDAHGYGFKWPLKEEVAYVTGKIKQGYMLIDDFKVPGNEAFGYDSYDGQTCSYDFIKDSFATKNLKLYYPCYKEKSSKHHPLRGWGLFVMGSEITIPAELKNKVYREDIAN